MPERPAEDLPDADRLRDAKLEALAEFAAGAGHEINNPLATIVGRVDLLLRRLSKQPRGGSQLESIRDLQIIAGQALRVREMISDLMLFARPPRPVFEEVDLADVTRDVLRSFTDESTVRSIALDAPAEGASAIIQADRTQLAVVVSELVRNALAAVDAGGRVEVRVEPSADGGRLVVDDDGRGLSELDRAHLFDPFYSGRPAGRGLGFGLPKCWRIVEMHGGRIAVEPRSGRGVTAIVDWPRRPPSSP